MRVSDRFRVIALGLPVPPYHGNPLDPPLRSRFQSRNVTHLPFHVREHTYVANNIINGLYLYTQEQLELLKYSAPNVSDKLYGCLIAYFCRILVIYWVIIHLRLLFLAMTRNNT